MTVPTDPSDVRVDQTLGQLLAGASRDMSLLVRSEIQLAKAELRVDVRNGAKAGAMFAAAAFVALLSVILLSITLAYVLVAIGLSTWLSFLIVTLLFLVIAGVLAWLGIRTVKRVRPPERTIRTSKDTARFLKHPRRARVGDGRG